MKKKLSPETREKLRKKYDDYESGGWTITKKADPSKESQSEKE